MKDISSYENRDTKELVSIWKGFQSGNPAIVETVLKRRIETQGKTGLTGPGKIIYLQHGNLRFTVLTVNQVCRKIGLLFDQVES